MATYVNIHDNVAERGATLIQNVNVPTPHTIEDIDRFCLRALRCPDALAIKNKLKARDRLLRKPIEWVLQHPNYVNWQQGSDFCLLWLKGGAGKGKTMISVYIVERLSTLRNNSTAVIYFFCRNDNNELNSPEAIIKGLIFRLIDQQKELKESLRRRWDTGNDCFNEDVTSWQILWNIFLEMLDHCKLQHLYVVIDGLDECLDEGMDELLKLIVRTGLEHHTKVKWLLTSRPLDIAEKELLSGHEELGLSLDLSMQQVLEGIKMYITSKVTELNQRHRYGETLQQKVEAELTAKAEGTYLWVSLVCEKLEDVPRDKALSTIAELPPGLRPLYHRMLNQLSNGKPDDVQKCMRLLKAMMLVYRPLDVREVGSVTGLTDEDLSMRATVDRCGSFIKMLGTKIEFVHLFARDYLAGEEGRTILDAHEHWGNIELALSCLSYLSELLKPNLVDLPRSDSTSQSVKELNEEKNKLLASVGYASTFWIQHLEAASRTVTIKNASAKAVHTFLCNKFLEWLECLSLLDKLPHAIEALTFLSNEKKANISPGLSIFAQDATRFILRHYQTLANWPVQIYSSAMVFSPKTSIVRRINSYKVPTWMTRMDLVDDNWGSLVQTLAGHYLCPVETVAFSSDNKHIVSCSRDDIKLWDVVTGNLKRTLRASSSIHQAAALSPDGKIILAGCLNGNIHLWDTLTGNLQKTLSCCPWIRAVGFSPNGRHIAFGSIDGTIHLCDTITWDQKTIDTITWDRKMMESRSPWVNTFTFSPDGKYIVSGSDDGAITLWNAMTGNAEKPLAGHSRSIRAVAFSPDGRSIISGSGDGIIKLWDVITGDVQRTVVFPLQGQGKYSSEVSPIALSPDGQYMASVSIDGKLKLWDTMTGNVHRILSHNSQGGLTSIAFSTDGKYIVSGSGDGTISLWDTTKQDLEIIPVRHTAPVSSVAFSQDGKYIVSSSYDGTIKIWDTTTGNLQRTLVGHAQNGYLLGIDVAAFSPDGRDIISAFSDGTMKLFDTVTGKLQKRLVDDVKVSAVAVSPDKRYILCGSRIGTIKLWDAVTGDLQKILRGHSESVRTMAFSPDGKYIASSYSDRTVRIWDVQKCIKTSKWLGNTLGRVLKSWLWREIRTTAVVRTLRFSPDGISLETNIGPIRLSGSLTDGESCPKGSLEYLWVQNQWIYYGLSCPILQLPAYLRPTCYTVRGDQITIGCGDGQVLNFAIDRRRLHSLLEDRTQQQSRPLLT